MRLQLALSSWTGSSRALQLVRERMARGSLGVDPIPFGELPPSDADQSQPTHAGLLASKAIEVSDGRAHPMTFGLALSATAGDRGLWRLVWCFAHPLSTSKTVAPPRARKSANDTVVLLQKRAPDGSRLAPAGLECGAVPFHPVRLTSLRRPSYSPGILRGPDALGSGGERNRCV